MKKKILISGLIISAIIISSILSLQFGQVESSSDVQDKNTIEKLATVTMPTKSSRPGCDETNTCYIPSKISIRQGESVTWLNEDAAFHSVTSGTYENPNGMFDSGYLDPNESFSIKFEESGTFDYFCTLHPWMKGKVIVE
ncbi:MAG: cupredoxin domain-containing protein [Thaumarchaeota archaeon]|jgi:plastocyanin|nr:cupredoxin domain-containing protein [Nitrososphaerota archaeon]